MNVLLATLSLFISFLSPVEPLQTSPSLQDVLSHEEFRKYQSQPKFRDQMNLFGRVMARYEKMLRVHVKETEIDGTLKCLKRLRVLGDHALQKASQPTKDKDLRSKQVKKLEIHLRKFLESIDDLKLSVPFAHRKEFETTAKSLEKLRNQLLKGIFGVVLFTPNDTKENKETRETKEIEADHLVPLPGDGVSHTPPPQGRLSGDRFTDGEFTELQEKQKLVERVKVFLKIAEVRLEEVQRRMRNEKKSKKEDNPLEFHTYWDMIHAYERAIEGIMINIDEKHQHKITKEKDIQTALRELNQKIVKFIPTLKAAGKIAIKSQDKALYEKVVKAEKTSAIAKEGSRYGLEALAK